MHRLPHERLRKARIDRGYETPTDAARYFGWAAPTYVSHENGTRNITPDAAKRYGAAFGVPAGWLLGLTDVHQVAAQAITLVGMAAFGVWREKSIDVVKNASKVSISLPNFKGNAVRFAVKVSDQSVNKSIQENEFAICEPFTDNAAITPGKLYYIERVKGELVERTIRNAALDQSGGVKFIAHSTASFPGAVTYPSGKSETITILGIVVGKYSELSL